MNKTFKKKRKGLEMTKSNSSREIPEGYLRDYISNEIIKAGKEEVEATQVFSRMLVEDYGYDKNQIQTRPQFRVKTSPSGQEKYPVDIVVFNNSNKSYENVFMLIECKQPTKKDGIDQLNIYLNLVPSVQIGVWFNGKEHAYFYKTRDKKSGLWKWEPLWDLPKKGQRLQDIGKQLFKRLLEKPKTLKSAFSEIRNYLAGNATGIVRDEAIATEVINLLFCKIYDEMHKSNNEEMDFRIGFEEDPKDVKKRIDALFEKVKDKNRTEDGYPDVFDENERIKLVPEDIAYVVGRIQNYEITKAERDVIGESFETFIGPALKGAEGQFFTPRNVVKMIVDILDPEPGEMLLDPACGSGGFLIVALEHIWKKIEKKESARGMNKEYIDKICKKMASEFIRGIDKDSFLAKVTKAYMAIVGDGRGGVFCENSLKPPQEWDNSEAKEKIKLGNFLVLMTNPPFGAKIPIRGENILRQYDLAYKWKYNDGNKKWELSNKLREDEAPQILFIERCLDFLKDGARMGIVLPDGILGNESLEYIRQFIIKEARILAVVDIPIETFMPNTSTKTSVLFLQKLRKGEVLDNYQIFMSVCEKCGHNRRGKEILEDDIAKVGEEYKAFKKKYA